MEETNSENKIAEADKLRITKRSKISELHGLKLKGYAEAFDVPTANQVAQKFKILLKEEG